MAQKKRTGKKGKKPSAKKPSKTSVSPSTRKTTKASVKGKATGSGKKKKAASAKKITVKKPTAKKTKPAKVQKSTVNKVKKMKASSSVNPRKAVSTPGSPKASTRTSSSELTVIERYNVGGLFACAIERNSDPEFKRLRSVLRELDLPSMERDNLIRLSQGFTIPKLFADGIAQDKVETLVGRLVKFAVGDGGYERKWKHEIRQVSAWLGLAGPAVEAIERRSGSK